MGDSLDEGAKRLFYLVQREGIEEAFSAPCTWAELPDHHQVMYKQIYGELMRWL